MIIANGAAAVTWQSTQIEMDKAALDKVNQVSLEHLLAVTSTSKTSLGNEKVWRHPRRLEGHAAPADQ